MKRGQEYTDYINASFIDVCMKNFNVFILQVRYFAVANKSFLRDTQSTWLMKNFSFFVWVWLMRVSKCTSYLLFSISV